MERWTDVFQSTDAKKPAVPDKSARQATIRLVTRLTMLRPRR
jgi:hypothetical protein